MKTRKMSIYHKLLFIMCFITIISILFPGLILYQKEKTSLIKQSKENGMALAAVAASQIKGDDLKAISPGDEETDNFKSIYNTLACFRDNSNIEYIYTMKPSDKSLVFVVDTDPEDPAAIMEEYDSVDEITQCINTGSPTSDTQITSDEWGSYYSAYAPIMDSNNIPCAIVGVDISVDWINSQLISVRNSILVYGIAFLFLAFVLAYLVSKNIHGNLLSLYKETTSISSGSGDLKLRLHIKSGDELENISDSMNQFINQIQDLMKKIDTVAKNLSIGNKNLLNVSNENKESITSINNSITNLSANMEETSASCDLIQDSLSAINDTTISLSKNIEVLTSYSTSMNQRGSKAKDDTLSILNTTKTEMIKIKDTLSNALIRSKEIEKVSEMAAFIEEIAENTKMLSLNARIESARAGEAGKGFAIVADSINSLSMSISDTVKEINNILTSALMAQQDLEDSCTNMSNFVENKVLINYEEMSGVCADYENDANYIQHNLSEFKRCLTDACNSIHDISNSIEEITHAIHDCTEQITETNLSTNTITVNMDTLTQTADSNSHLSGQLEEISSHYQY